MNKIEKINKQIRDLEEQKEKLKRKEVEKNIIPNLKKYVGNCYLGENGYSNDNKWDILFKIKSLNEHNLNMSVLKIEKTNDDLYKIEEFLIYNHSDECYFGGSDYTPISSEDFDEELNKALNYFHDNYFKKV
jgi:hypothetical protein